MPEIRTAARGVHLVGSVPLSNAEEVFTTAAEVLGDRLERVPDGETGDRTEWFHFQVPIFAATPGLEMKELRFSDDVDLPPDAPDVIHGFAPAAGVNPEDIVFGNLRYADEAIASYATFVELKRRGAMPGDVRFQVSLPTTAAVMSWALPEHRGALEPAYEKALLGEVAKMAAAIPHDQLAIQWDLCIEVYMIEGLPIIPPWFDDLWGGTMERISRHAAAVPDDVQLGFHLCYGDYKGERQAQPQDAANLVALAHRLVADVEHPIAWIHMPVPRGIDPRRFLAPLAGLSLPGETHLYLGLVYSEDGSDEASERARLAAEVVGEFGVATECGMGRRAPETVRGLMEIHRDVAAAVR
jgi:hypothetical protein